MKKGQKAAIGAAVSLFAAIVVGVIFTTYRRSPPRTITLTGAVIRQDADPRGRMPIGSVDITASAGMKTRQFKSDGSGMFIIKLQPDETENSEVTLRFQHRDYRPLEVTLPATAESYVARMVPLAPQERVQPPGPEVVIKDVKVRYSMKATATVNIGSLAKTFQVFNIGGVPCRGHVPCSPDGKWKATSASQNFDAGPRNEFQDIRVSCIAGPCPFAKITSETANDGRVLKVVALGWSDTTTFLVQAEVIHTMISDMVRYSIPVIFEDGMNFTLPATGVGPSVEASLNGSDIVFPLGPNVILPWATCGVKVDADRSKLFRCELKPGYRFEQGSQ